VDKEKLVDERLDSVGEISGIVIGGLRKKQADSTSANQLILDSILTNLHLTLIRAAI
jgi:hypothetical protein